MEQQSIFSVRSVYREAKVYFKRHFYYFFSAFLFIGIVNIALSAISPSAEEYSSLSLMAIGGVVAVLISIVGVFIQMYLQMKVMKATLSVVRDPDYVPQFQNFFVREGDGRTIVWRFFLTSILVGFFVLGGFILLIIPGIYIAIRMSFAVYILVDKKCRPMEAIRASWELTRGNFWKIFRFALITGFFFLITFIAFIVTIPLMQVMQITLYNRLQKGREVPSPVLEA